MLPFFFWGGGGWESHWDLPQNPTRGVSGPLRLVQPRAPRLSRARQASLDGARLGARVSRVSRRRCCSTTPRTRRAPQRSSWRGSSGSSRPGDRSRGGSGLRGWGNGGSERLGAGGGGVKERIRVGIQVVCIFLLVWCELLHCTSPFLPLLWFHSDPPANSLVCFSPLSAFFVLSSLAIQRT